MRYIDIYLWCIMIYSNIFLLEITVYIYYKQLIFKNKKTQSETAFS